MTKLCFASLAYFKRLQCNFSFTPYLQVVTEVL